MKKHTLFLVGILALVIIVIASAALFIAQKSTPPSRFSELNESLYNQIKEMCGWCDYSKKIAEMQYKDGYIYDREKCANFNYAYISPLSSNTYKLCVDSPPGNLCGKITDGNYYHLDTKIEYPYAQQEFYSIKDGVYNKYSITTSCIQNYTPQYSYTSAQSV